MIMGELKQGCFREENQKNQWEALAKLIHLFFIMHDESIKNDHTNH